MSLAETAINSFIDRRLAQPRRTAARKPAADRSLTKGIIAGVVAGLAAAAAKSLVEKVYPPRVAKDAPPEPAYWAFGAAAGAAYGALAEYYPAAASGDGVNFGMTLLALTQDSALPALGPAASQTTRETTSEMASCVVFGLVAETTRHFVRKML